MQQYKSIDSTPSTSTVDISYNYRPYNTGIISVIFLIM